MPAGQDLILEGTPFLPSTSTANPLRMLRDLPCPRRPPLIRKPYLRRLNPRLQLFLPSPITIRRHSSQQKPIDLQHFIHSLKLPRPSRVLVIVPTSWQGLLISA